MADYDRRHGGGGGGGGRFNNRKRRYQDDGHDQNIHNYQRRRHEPPVPIRIRKQLLGLADSPHRRWHEEVTSIANLLCENVGESGSDNHDPQLRETFVSLVCQLAVEQPLKTPFVAAVVLVVNTLRPEIAFEVVRRVAENTAECVVKGEWRGVKLNLKLLACLQSCLEGEGVFPVLEELFNRAGELQASNENDTIGIELVKIILLTIPYIMAVAPGQWAAKAAELMEKTEIIAGEAHPMQTLVDPFHPKDGEESPAANSSVIGLLQKQLQAEAQTAWELKCLPRPWKMPLEEVEQQAKLDDPSKHALPSIVIPEQVIAGPRQLFPEIYLSFYQGQDVESVPPVTDIAASLVRDGLLDTINGLDFNRNITARFFNDIDCFFADGTFVKRATPFDRLRDIEAGKSTWKPEDMAVDAVFSQLFSLPVPEHKLVYYHSVLTEACKIAPAAIAPSLGRAIRFLYRNNQHMDLELGIRFVDWFSHHLSNFGFTWKWSEWVEDVALPDMDARKAFIRGAIDKEIRLSFASRIKNTLPEPYRELIGPEKEKDVPDFKYRDESHPFSAEGRELVGLLKRKAADDEIQPVIERIHSRAIDTGLDPLATSTDALTTAILFVGSKTLSHVLAAIERNRDRLAGAGDSTEAARTQVVASVMDYWAAHPGVAIVIVEKLLNYAVISPAAVVRWAFGAEAGAKQGKGLAESHVYELVFKTVAKVTTRTRQVVSAPPPAPPTKTDGDVDMIAAEEATAAAAAAAAAEVKATKELFRFLDEELTRWTREGDKDVARWAQRWQRVFSRRAAIEDAFVAEQRRPVEAVAA